MVSLLAGSVSAQTDEMEEYNEPRAFVSLQGGVLRNYNGQGIDRKWSPLGAVSFGYNFTDVFGLRFQTGFSAWNVELQNGDKFSSKFLSLDLDMLFNFSNLFFPGRFNRVSVIGVAGVPFNLVMPHVWIDNAARSEAAGDRWNPGWKGGGMIAYNFNRHWNVNVEAGTRYVRQDNGLTTKNERWWPYGMIGVTYKFNFKKAKRETVEEAPAEPLPVATPTQVAEPVVVSKPVVAPSEPVKKVQSIQQDIFFQIASAEIQDSEKGKIQNVIDWMKANPSAKTIITGHADAGTGNPTINASYSQQRAEAVAKQLADAGIEANRLTVEAKGDKVMPYGDNEKSRVAIIICEDK